MLVSRPNPNTTNAAPSGWSGGYRNQSATVKNAIVYAICG
jgi:hypothetical protein